MTLLFSIILYSPFCLRLSAQETALTYQGQLNLNGSPGNGNYDFQFVLFNTNQFGFPAAPILTNANISVNNGIFTTALDFGGGIFTGSNYWLDVSVRTNGNGSFTDLSPRQPITPAPYAIAAASLTGVVENNSVQTGVSMGTIGGGAGNAIQTGASFATVGGGGNNVIQSGADHSTIGGGSGNNIAIGAWESFVGGGQNNYIYAQWSAIAGGLFNTIMTNSSYSFIGSGLQNLIQTNAFYSTISGGELNSIQNGAYGSTVAGGTGNSIRTNAYASTISGGSGNNIQTNAIGATIGGGTQNTIQTNAFFSTIGGGTANSIAANTSTIAGGNGNNIAAAAVESFIGGGLQNVIETSATESVIAGGEYNKIQADSFYSSIVGGAFNLIQTNVYQSMIGSGDNNVIRASAVYCTIVGGGANTIISTGNGATIGGGFGNTNGGYAATLSGGRNNIVSGDSSELAGGYLNSSSGNFSAVGGGLGNTNSGYSATIPGGNQNLAAGDYSFAAGKGAQALHPGSFVWADSQSPFYSSDRNNQFKIRAAGGVQMDVSGAAGLNPAAVTISSTSGNGVGLYVAQTSSDATEVVGNDGTGDLIKGFHSASVVFEVQDDGTVKSKGVILTSDRNAKENFVSLDPKSVLAKVTAMPITEWNYKDDNAVKKHIGPVAQDFYSAFGLNGTDDKHISVVDEGGVALAAIQGLNQKVDEQRSELKQKQTEIAELKMRLEKLERILNQKIANTK